METQKANTDWKTLNNKIINYTKIKSLNIKYTQSRYKLDKKKIGK